jgi:hypothetical protein
MVLDNHSDHFHFVAQHRPQLRRKGVRFFKINFSTRCQEMRRIFPGGRELHEIAHHWRSVGNFDRLLPHSAAGIAGALHVERLYSQNRGQSAG